MNLVPLPKPELKGFGVVIYRCATCGGLVDAPIFSDGVRAQAEPFTEPGVRTYHAEHLPEGDNRGR